MATIARIFPKNAKTNQRLVIFSNSNKGLATSVYANVTDDFTLVEGEEFDLGDFEIETVVGSDGTARKWVVA